MSISADQRTLRYNNVYPLLYFLITLWQPVLSFVVGVFTVVVLDRKSEQRRLQHAVQYSRGHYFHRLPLRVHVLST